jgi:aspartate 1-decarboxylase
LNCGGHLVTSKWQNNVVTKNSTNHEDSCKIDKTTLDVVARFEKSMVDALKSTIVTKMRNLRAD